MVDIDTEHAEMKLQFWARCFRYDFIASESSILFIHTDTQTQKFAKQRTKGKERRREIGAFIFIA